jgi:predicted secreted protein
MKPAVLARALLPLLLLAFVLAPAFASPAEPTTIDLSAEASTTVTNDLGRAQLYVEHTDTDTARLAERVNRIIAEALEVAKSVPEVHSSTAGITTYPVHTRDGERIEGWRMRASIDLESRDLNALSRLIGRLQQTLAVSSVTIQPATDTRAKAADIAAVDALRAFEARAAVLANTLGMRYRIRHLSVQYPGTPPVYPLMRANRMMATAEAMPAPIEPGQSDVSVTVSGTIELIE